MILAFSEHPAGLVVESGTCVVYDVGRDTAYFGAATVDGHALVWALAEPPPPPGARLAAEVDLDPTVEWLVRCDRVDFPPGGVAYTHTHPGPGIRCLLFGSIRIASGGASHDYGPFEPWFESGPEPVHAAASDREASAFVRVMLLPREWEGQRTIRYVDPRDEDRPKLQRARIFLERPITA